MRFELATEAPTGSGCTATWRANLLTA